MADAAKNHLLLAELKSLFSVVRTRRIKLFAYGFMIAFVACTVYIAFNPNGSSSPWYNRIFSAPSTAPYNSQLSSFFSFFFPEGRNASKPVAGDEAISDLNNKEIPGKSNISSFPAPKEVEVAVSRSFNSSSRFPRKKGIPESENAVPGKSGENRNASSSLNAPQKKEITVPGSLNASSPIPGKKANSEANKEIPGKSTENSKSSIRLDAPKNESAIARSFNVSSPFPGKKAIPDAEKSISGKSIENRNSSSSLNAPKKDAAVSILRNVTMSSSKTSAGKPSNTSSSVNLKKTVSDRNQSPNRTKEGIVGGNRGISNHTASLLKRNVTGSGAVPENRRNGNFEHSKNGAKGEKMKVSLEHCNIFEGRWVRDDSYPLYKEGSCPHIDEPFNCFLNGRPDRNYQKLRWQPSACNIPRLNGTDMLERLRGKRLVFVGDSLNRNMWESLVCVLRNSVKDKRKVFEASGRHEFRTEGSYSFIFKDYNCSIEFFRSPFLVQEWENPEPNGKRKETLRLDVIERSSSKYKNADVIIFNTGHWWTHEKTSKGKDYYQEGSHIYGKLNVGEAFRKALTTWARWVDANINRRKSLVFFRGYSASHFSGGRWNYGGACDRETEPINNETYLAAYPPKMSILESVMKGMKTPVNYLNITRMTDYRKDAHPSVYRKKNLSDEERRSPERYQDCSHWCLPGVPDTWNELVYAQLIIKQRRRR